MFLRDSQSVDANQIGGFIVDNTGTVLETSHRDDPLIMPSEKFASGGYGSSLTLSLRVLR